MDGEVRARIQDVPNVGGSRLPAGRALDAGEIRALFDACRDDAPGAARDAAAFALMFGCGLRRSEAVAVRLEDCDMVTGTIRVIGKGNRERLVHARNGAGDALQAWRAWRGDDPGPLLVPVDRHRRAALDPPRPMSAQALMRRLKLRARQAGIGDCSPHDLRRTFVSAALDAGADLALVQRLAGHANPQTTARYDRRPEEAARRAADMVHVPFAAAMPGEGRTCPPASGHLLFDGSVLR